MLEVRHPYEAIDSASGETDTTNLWNMITNFNGSWNTRIAAPIVNIALPNRNSWSPNGISRPSKRPNARNAVPISNATRPNGNNASQNANGGTPERSITRARSNERRKVTSNNSGRNRNDSINLVINRRNNNSNNINIPIAPCETRDVLVNH